MRRTAWLPLPALLAGCYLSPSKHDSDEALINPVNAGGNGADAAPPAPAACTQSSSCSAAAPRCAAGSCAPCTQHADCSAFLNTPACGPAGACVACAADELRACKGAAPSCDQGTGQCIECTRDAHCLDPQRSVCNLATHTCEPCSSDAQCSHVPGAHLCIANSCAECTAKSLDACRESLSGDARQYVCDPATHRCDKSRLAHSKDLCDTCVSDLECAVGQLCVDTPAGAGSKVCQLQIQPGMLTCPRPYGITNTPVTSADGVRAPVCSLLVTSTTCEAQRQYRNGRCGTPKSDDPKVDEPNSWDDTKCGVAGRDDGYCVYYEAVSQYRCTTPCRNSADDCVSERDIRCLTQDHQTGRRTLCEL